MRFTFTFGEQRFDNCFKPPGDGRAKKKTSRDVVVVWVAREGRGKDWRGATSDPMSLRASYSKGIILLSNLVPLYTGHLRGENARVS